MAKIKESLYNLFDYDVDLEKRIIYIGSQKTTLGGDESGVEASLSEKVVKALYLMEVLAPDGEKDINILINGPGGDYYHAMAIYGAIKRCKSRVIATVFGSVMSAHSVIFQAADERVMDKYSKQMIHYGTFGIDNHTKTFKSWSKESEKIDREMENIYLERIKEAQPDFTRAKLQKLLNFDTILNAEESKELGLCDKVT